MKRDVANQTGGEREIQTVDPQKQQPEDQWSRFRSAAHSAEADSEQTVEVPRHVLQKFIIVALLALFGLGVVVIDQKFGLYNHAAAYISIFQQKFLRSDQGARRESDSARQTQAASSRHGKIGRPGQAASRGKGSADSNLTPTIYVQVITESVRPLPPFEVTAVDARRRVVLQPRNVVINVDIAQPPPSTLNSPTGQTVLAPIRSSPPNAISEEQTRLVTAALGDGQGLTKTVTLRGVITKNGTIEALRQISGPPELLPAAIEVVRQAKFQPSKSKNFPAEGETQIAVNFTVHNK